jgi:RNA polymerase sigma factor (sigma-70 family)
VDELDLVRRGDREARDHWVAAWWPRVYRMALAMTGREADAEDLAQETLIAGLAAVERFRGESSEGTWLYAILLRKYRSQARRRPPEPRAPERSKDASADAAEAMLAVLPPPQRITAALFYVEDLSVEEIARALGIPRATVRWRLFRARQTLRRRLAGESTRRMCEETL